MTRIICAHPTVKLVSSFHYHLKIALKSASFNDLVLNWSISDVIDITYNWHLFSEVAYLYPSLPYFRTTENLHINKMTLFGTKLSSQQVANSTVKILLFIMYWVKIITKRNEWKRTKHFTCSLKSWWSCRKLIQCKTIICRDLRLVRSRGKFPVFSICYHVSLPYFNCVYACCSLIITIWILFISKYFELTQLQWNLVYPILFNSDCQNCFVKN